MSQVSVVMPVYNVERFVSFAINSVLQQSFSDFELLIVNDGATDSSLSICKSFHDPRIKIITQKNRGLAGARNTGIRHASGDYVAFIDSDDLWHKDKLKRHVKHLQSNPDVGVSYSPSLLVDEHNRSLGIKQNPKLQQISFKNIICRNPIGNGSAPVIRKDVLEATCFYRYHEGVKETCYFDETFRQSEDIEYWLRIALCSDKKFEGLPETLTYYRVNSSGLSANVGRQYLSWERAITKAALISPKLVNPWIDLARAYQLRYLARHAIKAQNAKKALRFCLASLKVSSQVIIEEPVKTLSTLISAFCFSFLPKNMFGRLEQARSLFLKKVSPIREGV